MKEIWHVRKHESDGHDLNNVGFTEKLTGKDGGFETEQPGYVDIHDSFWFIEMKRTEI